MSKTQLKKELATLSREDLQAVILDLYASRKEAKAWLDFFVNPDLEALTDKYRFEIDREMSRGKYGKSTARISRVRSSIREYASFGVDAEAVIDIMLYALKAGLRNERLKYVSKTYMNGMVRLASDILKVGDRRTIFDTAFRGLEEALNGSYGYLNFVNYIRREIDWTPLTKK